MGRNSTSRKKKEKRVNKLKQNGGRGLKSEENEEKTPKKMGGGLEEVEKMEVEEE